MKETYIAPEMEVVEFESEDIITTSGGPSGSADGWEDGGGWGF